MARLKSELSPALVISLIALFVALGGGAYAALGKNSVGPQQLKIGAVTTKKISNGAVSASKIRPGSVTRTKIASGALGPQVVAFATVDEKGRVIPSQSRGISQENIGGGYPYPVCLSGLPAFKTAVVTPISTKSLYVVTSSIKLDDLTDCTDGDDAQLEVDTWIEERYLDYPEQLPYPSQEAFTVALLK